MTDKTKLNEPAFLIELSHQLRHILMRRAYFLRSTRARTMIFRERIEGKSWLEVSLVEKAKADTLPWDQAHGLADKLRAELKSNIFVEPASQSGRHHQLTTHIAVSGPSDAGKQVAGGNNSFGWQDPMARVFGGAGNTRNGAAGSFGMSMPGIPNIPGMSNLGGRSHFGGVQNPTDFLPAHAKEALSAGESKSNDNILLALRQLSAFNELPEATRNMFEVEAVQLLRENMIPHAGATEHSGDLIALSQLSNVSKRLKKFLAQSLAQSLATAAA